MSEKDYARVEIKIGQTARDCSVHIDGIDVTSIVTHMTVSVGCHDMSQVTLTLGPWCRVTMDREMLRQQVMARCTEVTDVKPMPTGEELPGWRGAQAT